MQILVNVDGFNCNSSVSEDIELATEVKHNKNLTGVCEGKRM